MATPNLAIAFGLPPERAVEYFRSRGLQLAGDWKQAAAAARAGAFSVAGVLKADVLQDLRSAMDRAVADGITFHDWRRQVRAQLASKGYLSKVPAEPDTGEVLPGRGLSRPWHLDTVFRTNTQGAYMAGRYKAQVENAQRRPYWMYVAVMDSRTRQAHRALNGRVFRWDDPVWGIAYPPNGYRCRCRVRALGERELAAERLPLSSSEGRLETVDVDLGPRGGTVRVTKYRDPLTGQLAGPDPGFDHAPAGAWGRDAALARSVQQLPTRELRVQAWQALNRNPERQAVLRDFVADVLARRAAGQPVGGERAEVLGFVGDALADAVRAAAPQLQPARVAVLTEREVLANAGRGDQALTPEQYASLPGLLTQPDQVLWDNQARALVLVRRLPGTAGRVLLLRLPAGDVATPAAVELLPAAALLDAARYRPMQVRP